MKILIIGILFSFASLMSAQMNLDLAESEMIGFACYAAGSATDTVRKFEKKLANKNYKWIAQKLSSTINAEKYMSVLILEQLNNLDRYVLSEEECQLIEEVKKSYGLVSVCSGCTYFDKLSLRDMLNEENELMGSWWLDYHLNIKKAKE